MIRSVRIHNKSTYGFAKAEIVLLSEDANRCRAQILFEGQLSRKWIHRLVLNLDRNPHFCGSTALDKLFVKVFSAAEPGSSKSLIEIGHGVG